MIPKIIHYCWFGKNQMPDLALKCIESWKKFCPDYIIKEWNEDNFDLNCCNYVKEAYEAKKWAFITDYVRLYALVNEGGIYMDTDVEVIKELDSFMVLKAYSGFETDVDIPTGIMACEKDFPLFRELLNDYNDRHFVLKDGQLDLTTNVVTITRICSKYGLVRDNSKQTIKGFTLYPREYFCPKDHHTGLINITENTYTIHHFSGSWQDKFSKKIMKREAFFINVFGERIGKLICPFFTLGLRIRKKINSLGVKKTIKFALSKLKKM